jgi:hypothetical protein
MLSVCGSEIAWTRIEPSRLTAKVEGNWREAGQKELEE